MTKTQFLAVLAAPVLAVGLTTSTALAQQGPPQQATAGIALLDVSRVFKEHVRFKAEMNGIKAEAQTEEGKIKQRAEELQQRVELLKTYTPGSPDYKRLEEELTKFQSDMKVDIQLQRKEFLQREAKVVHRVYREIQQEVGYFAGRYGVGAVLQFSNETAASEQPEQVFRNIGKSVIWFAPHLDITNDIIGALNNGATAPANPQGTVPYQPATRQGVPRR